MVGVAVREDDRAEACGVEAFVAQVFGEGRRVRLEARVDHEERVAARDDVRVRVVAAERVNGDPFGQRGHRMARRAARERRERDERDECEYPVPPQGSDAREDGVKARKCGHGDLSGRCSALRGERPYPWPARGGIARPTPR